MNTNRDFIDAVVKQSTGTLLSRRGWLRLGVVFLFLGGAAQLLSDMVDADEWWVHGVWCFCCLVITIPVLAKVFRSRFGLVLSDHLVMFTGAFTLYFLFGGLFLWLGEEDKIAMNLSYYPSNAKDALRVDAVNAIGFGLALLAASLSSGRWLGSQAGRLAMIAKRVPASVVMVVLMAVGLVASFYVLLVDLAILPGVISGTWRLAANFILIAILLASSYPGRHEGIIRLAAIGVAIVQAASGLLMFSKSGVLLPMGTLVAGLAVRYGARTILLPGLLLMGAVLLAITGVVSYGRNNLDIQGGIPIPLTERWAVIKEGFAAANADDESTESDTWGRLCYTVPATAAMDFYERGRGGDDLSLIPWAFVPRVLAPGKPIMTRSGAELHEKVTGSTTSQTGTGIFVSGYYNAGWAGVVLASLLCGWLLAQTSAIAHAILARQAFILLPLAMMGVFMAFRIDGNFVADYLGAFVYILYPLLGTAMLLSARRGRR